MMCYGRVLSEDGNECAMVNGLIFGGEQVVKAASLSEAGAFSQYKAETGRLHEQERDSHKLWRGHRFSLYFGAESQTRPDKDMPFRIISYDGASYRSQLLKTERRLVKGKIKQVKSKKRYPVISIVLYFGKYPWKYPKNLVDCFRPALPEDAVIAHVDEFLKLMKVLTGDNRYEEIARSFTVEEKEDGIMACRGLDAREARGEARGITLGENRMGNLVNRLLEEKKYEEIKKVTTDKKIREEYYALYNI